MMTSRNDRFFKGGFGGLLIAAAVLCGASAAQAALPTGYAEHEYLESTGTQYIDTGVVITPTMAVEADAQADYKTQTDANFLVYGPVENQGGVGLLIFVR